MTKFKVGDWWRTQGGWYVEIESIDSDNNIYPIITTLGYCYTQDGLYLENESGHIVDLVQKMKPPVWEEDNE